MTAALSSSRTARLALVVLACLAVAAVPALAQDTTIRPPTPSATEDPPLLRTYLVLVLLAGAVIGANAIPARRGHQD